MLFRLILVESSYSLQIDLVGLHFVSDLLMALAYYSIPLVIIYFVYKRKNIAYLFVFLLFGIYSVLCGTTHLIQIWTLWHPNYWLSGMLKATTALISLYTVGKIYSIVPIALEAPSAAQLQEINQKLEEEIAKHQQTEKELYQEKVFIKAVFDNLSDGIVACDRNGVLAVFNQASCGFFGMPETPISSEKWSEYYALYYPDGKTYLKKEDIPLYRAFSGESFTNVELVTSPKNAKTRTLLANGSPILDRDGIKIGAVVAVRDTSEQKKAEHALRDSESILRSFYNSAPIAMGIVESEDYKNFKYISHNNATAKFMESIPDITETTLPSQLTTSLQNKQKLTDACLQSKIDRQPVNFEFSETVDRNAKHFSITVATIVRESLSEKQLFSYFVQDISARKHIEQTLQESEERFRLAFEDAAIGMALVDISGHFLRANQSLCRILGYSESQLLRVKFQDITYPEDLNVDLNYLNKVLKGAIDNYQMEKRYFHKLGHQVWCLLNVSLVRDVRQQPQYLIAQIQDISDRKAAQLKVIKSLQEKEVMLQEIHHRVKNNLQVICSLLNLQARYLKEEKITKGFKETQNRVRSMALVHEQLYQSTNLSHIVLADYIKQLVSNLFRAYSIRSNVKYHTEIEEFDLDLDTAVSCGLIINEIISNSLKYAFNGRETGELKLQAFANESQNLVLIIEDNGVGIPVDFNLKKSKSLGLKLVSNLVQQLQGNFEFNSTPNLGTQFTFTFTRITKKV